VRDIVGRVWLYVVIGIAVGADIHGFVPTAAMASIMGKDAWQSVPLSVPEMIILGKGIKPRLIAAFIGVMSAGILIVGHLSNALL
jgi:uncharacterized protein